MIRSAGICVNWLLRLFGVRLIKVPDVSGILNPAIRSIARGNTTASHNTRENMDVFYSDPHLLTHYFTDDRLAFYDQVQSRLARLNIQPADVMDVGCGSGHLLAHIRTLYKSAALTGVDFSPEAVCLARKLNPTFEFEVLSIFELESIGRKFDLVLCTEVIEHLVDADVAVQKLVDRCKDGGTLVITVPHGRRDTFVGHFNFWTPESFRREFRNYLPEVEELDSYLFIAISKPSISC